MSRCFVIKGNSLINLDAAIEEASNRSESPATVALRLIARQPGTLRRGGSDASGCLVIHFAKSHNVSGVVLLSAPVQLLF
jgi:hypothetical protein